MMSLKTVPPTMRKKQRYLIFKIESEKKFGIGEVVESIWEELLGFLGESGVSEADPWIMKDLFYRDKQVAGIKTDKDHVEEIRTALALIDEIDGENVCIYVKGVSGTMKAAKKKFI